MCMPRMKKRRNKNIKRCRLLRENSRFNMNVFLYRYTKRRHALKNTANDSWKNLIRRPSHPLVLSSLLIPRDIVSLCLATKMLYFRPIPEKIIKHIQAHPALSTISRIRLCESLAEDVTYCFVKLLISISR